jgi:hypothetical protein
MVTVATLNKFMGELGYHRLAASLQKRNRSPTVGAMLLRWRKPEANPPFTCVNMIPE